MSDFKPGDRVRVEFEAEVVQMPYRLPDGIVSVSGGIAVDDEDEFEIRNVRVSQCTLIEPEIVLPEIPGTIVQVDPLNEHNARLAFENVENDGRSWSESGEIAIWSTSELIDQCRRYGYRVIPVAEQP